MGRTAVVILLLVLSSWRMTMGEGEGEGEGEGGSRRGLFILEKAEQVVRSEGGEVRVVKGFGFPEAWPEGWGWGLAGGRRGLMHIGFIAMEPNTLFVPHYLDSSLVIFVRRGDVKVGWIYKDALVERQLKMGDIIHIPSGSTFYMVNTGKGQRLQMICSIDASESLGWSPYQAFYVGGGTHPQSVLAGFDSATLAVAFNVTTEELHTLLRSRTTGPIVYVTGEAAERPPRRERDLDRRGEGGEEINGSWTWRKLLNGILGGKSDAEDKDKGKAVRSPDPYNLYDHDPNYRNKYGWTIALGEEEYHPLKHSDIGVYLVNLTAGSMLAPHVNPTATEYGVVLGGSGTIQVVFPNGTTAMNAEVAAGDVFWIPRYFPFCQIASLSGPLEFFGFTTSARRNRPQFLIGQSSVLRAMVGPELAAGFGVSEEQLRDVVEAQKESIILPSWPEKERRGGGRGEEELLLINKMAYA
ncbi:vicilin-like seed storage protein At2g28490 [Typha latifolia]|uniref:vicilin-like seed storage protein At2g28490 n=1 Tax=Typha latifolia TaxID=4733 RepID=UPI003C2CE75C